MEPKLLSVIQKPAWFEPCLPLFLSFHLSLSSPYSSLTFALVHLSFLFYVIYLHIHTEVVLFSLYFQLFSFYRYPIKLDRQASRWYQLITRSSKRAGVFFLSQVSEAQNNYTLEVIHFFIHYICCRSILFSYSHFPLISIVSMTCFSKLKFSLNLFNDEA